MESIDVDIEDVKMAIKLIAEEFGFALNDVEKMARKFLVDKLDNFYPKGDKRESAAFTRAEIAAGTTTGQTSLQGYIKELEKWELLVKCGKRDGAVLYRLCWNGIGIDGKKICLALDYQLPK